jgi:hypothetical protein
MLHGNAHPQDYLISVSRLYSIGYWDDELEESSCGLNEVLFAHLPEGTTENHKNFSQDSQCLSKHPNCALPKSKPLPLDQHVQS